MGVDLLDQKFEWRCRDLVGRGWHLACPDTDSFSVDFKIGRGTPRSLYTLLNLCMSLFCLVRVSLFAMGRVLT